METIIGTCGNCGGPVVIELPLKRYCKICKGFPQDYLLDYFGPRMAMLPPGTVLWEKVQKFIDDSIAKDAEESQKFLDKKEKEQDGG